MRVITDHPTHGVAPVSTAGQIPGLTFERKEHTAMAKAQERGIYTVDGRRFVVNKGDPIPAGAEVEGGETAETEVVEEETSKKTTKKRGPSEGADASGPSETT